MKDRSIMKLGQREAARAKVYHLSCASLAMNLSSQIAGVNHGSDERLTGCEALVSAARGRSVPPLCRLLESNDVV